MAGARRDRSWRVPPEAAHKRRAENLWLTTATSKDGALIVEFQIPAAVSPVRFAELMEVQRQAAIVYAHRVLGVAGDAVFVLSAISLELASGADSQPLPERGGTIIVRPTPPTSLPTATASAQFEMTAGARATAHGSVEARFLSPRVYARLRATTVASPTAPAPSTARARQDFDLRNPLVTDHDVDHVPAMAIISRLEQSLIADASRVERLHLQFRSYLETHLPASLDIDDHGHGEFSGHARQAGQVKATFHGRVNRTCTGTPTRRVSV